MPCGWPRAPLTGAGYPPGWGPPIGGRGSGAPWAWALSYAPDPASGVADPDPPDALELLVRRAPGEDAVERELAPPVRVRVDGLAAVFDDAALARVEGLAAVPEAALVRAAGLADRSSSVSGARTRCCRRATSSRLAMPRTPSWRFTSRWTRRVMISRFLWVRRIRSSATRFTWADCTSPCLASRDATRSAWVRVRSLRLASACRYCSLALGTSPPPAHGRGQDSVSGPGTGQRTGLPTSPCGRTDRSES